MIEIVGTALNQWDTGRVVHITGIEAEYAHFANKGDSKAVIMGVVDIEAKIPDYLLQTGKPLCVYAVKDGVTIESRTFSVRNRERPENYVYEDDQRNYIYELITSAEKAVAAAYKAAENANPSAEEAKEAANNANKATSGANEAADTAILAAKSATEAAAKAAHTAKSLMVVGGAEGANIALDDAIDQYLVGLRIFGKSTQAGTPTPDAPVDIVSVGDGGSITVNAAGAHEVNSMTIETPNGLPGIPVSSDGNYTDANGQQWICDEVDLGRGVYVQRINIVGLENAVGAREPRSAINNTYRFSFPFVSNPTFLPSKQTAGMCNVFTYSFAPVGNNDVDNAIHAYMSGGVYARCDAYETVSDFLAWAKSVDLKVQYILATPIETHLSEEELAAYAELHTYRGNTTVSNDASAHMEIEYAMYAKKYIDSMISTAILEATVE